MLVNGSLAALSSADVLLSAFPTALAGMSMAALTEWAEPGEKVAMAGGPLEEVIRRDGTRCNDRDNVEASLRGSTNDTERSGLAFDLDRASDDFLRGNDLGVFFMEEFNSNRLQPTGNGLPGGEAGVDTPVADSSDGTDDGGGTSDLGSLELEASRLATAGDELLSPLAVSVRGND